jgi:hypothetical protein
MAKGCGTLGRKAIPVEDKLLSGIEVSDDGCWNWTKARNALGYGRVRVSTHRVEFTHRACYEIHEGPIPEGLVLDHLCRNPSCCNPAHLEPVTQRVNLLRGETLQAANVAKTHCPYGHEFSPDNTRLLDNGGRRCRACERRRANEHNARRRGVL